MTLSKLQLALWQKVELGINIGCEVDDYICAECWKEQIYTPIKTICPKHGAVEMFPEYIIEKNPRFTNKYETKLIKRLKEMNKTKALMVAPPQQDLNRMKQIVRAGMVGVSQDYGEWTDMIVALVSYDALRLGLAPGIEIFPYVKKDKQGVVQGITTGINYKGLERLARRQSDFLLDHSKKRVLSASEVEERRLHLVPYYYERKPSPDEVIVVEIPLYRMDVYEKALELAEKAKNLGIDPIPVGPTVIGQGIWLPSEPIPSGRTAEWRATLRATKDAINKAFDISFEVASKFVDDEPNIIIEEEEVEESSTHFYTADEVQFVTTEVEEHLGYDLPGDKLGKRQINYLYSTMLKLGFDNVQTDTLIRRAFGEGAEKFLTDLAGKNLIELGKRVYLVKTAGLTDKVCKKLDISPDLDIDMAISSLSQTCFSETTNGVLWTGGDVFLKELKIDDPTANGKDN